MRHNPHNGNNAHRLRKANKHIQHRVCEKYFLKTSKTSTCLHPEHVSQKNQGEATMSTINLDSVEWDESPTASAAYTLTIWPRGLLNFSADSVKRFDLEKYPAVRIGLDKKRNLLVFQFLDDINTPGAIKTARRQKGIVISAKGTLLKFGVSTEKPSRRFPLEFGETPGVLAINLDKGVDVGRSSADGGNN